MSRSVVEHVRLVAPTEEHIDAIAARARPADVDEIWATGHHTVAQAMLAGMRYSTMAYTALFYDKPVCMFGVAPASLLGSKGIPWMIGTVDLEQYQFMFLRRSKAQLRKALLQYAELENYVDARNALAQRWLRWMGFALDTDAVPYGPDKMPFIRFRMSRSAQEREMQHV